MFRPGWKAPTIAIAAVTILALVGGGVAYAASSKSSVKVCVTSKNVVRAADAKGKCPTKTRGISINAQGQVGPQGAAGVDGVAGAPGATGSTGATGATGAPGVGTAGPQGDPGPAGPAGPQGPVGTGGSEVDTNPNDLTYRIHVWSTLTAEPVIAEANGFTQKITNSSTLSAGGGAGQGKNSIGPVVVKLPLSSVVVQTMTKVPRSTRIAKVRVEMCETPEVSSTCLLAIDMEDVIVTRITSSDTAAADPAAVTMNLISPRETVTHSFARGSHAVTYDQVNETTATSGAPDAAMSSHTPFLTSFLSDTNPRQALGTLSWGLTVENNADLLAGAGKATFSAIEATTRSGRGTIQLLTRLLKQTREPQGTISGCSVDGCTQAVGFTDTNVVKVVLGSPTLTDDVEFGYSTIKWDRADIAGANKTFGWNVAENRP